ncbi:L-ribulose-5-phosphate 4-epimerase [Microbacterium pseudoresistens]|uniref:Ribulose-5-phosphate 4-epimerase/fuculose-1-phosphate aldolase n=1 Tax=Microbacterium pseudoresistens TaxID=640634 RepID=A0A7Y9EXJ0_9MICO|nr:class II aldolase/adducin family protein [Microbacterium pseudoresistens]NYD54890.1 ribulose-5-phosphate 4-epimerase/fuculose-1-phosphate aldolase [Microbacterium pseudoresistens]
MSANIAEAKELVAEAGRILHVHGLVDYLGHVSIRVGDQVVIKPKHSPTVRGLSTLTADRIITVDLEGRKQEGEGIPVAETFIHTEIYKARPDVQAVVHTHQHATTVLGVLERPILPLLHIPASYVDEHDFGLYPHAHLVTTPEQGANLAKALGDKTFCHLQNHGIVSVAETLQEATVNALLLEELARTNLEVLQTGLPPRLIPDDELADLREFRGPWPGRWEYFREQTEIALAGR